MSAHLDSTKQLVNREVSECIERLSTMLQDCRVLLDRWGSVGSRFAIADTNVFLHHEQPLDEVDWRRVLDVRTHERLRLVVPLVVVDELDKQKGLGKQAVRIRARETLRKLTDLFRGNVNRVRVLNAGDPQLTVELLMDDHDHRRHPHNDSELVDRAVTLKDLVAPQWLRFVAGHVSMAFRARHAGLDVVSVQLPDRTAAVEEEDSVNRAAKHARRQPLQSTDPLPPASEDRVATCCLLIVRSASPTVPEAV